MAAKVISRTTTKKTKKKHPYELVLEMPEGTPQQVLDKEVTSVATFSHAGNAYVAAKAIAELYPPDWTIIVQDAH